MPLPRVSEDVRIVFARNESDRLKCMLRAKINTKVSNLVQAQAWVQSCLWDSVGSLFSDVGEESCRRNGKLARMEGEFSGYISAVENILIELAPETVDANQWISETIRDALGEALVKYGTADHPYHPDHVDDEPER